MFGPHAVALEKDATHRRLLIGAGIGAAMLIGFGIVMWVAANWSDMGRMTRFGLVGGGLAAGCVAAMAHSASRIGGALVAFLATGGLLALFGQTYQSGADPWELFALWAALAAPLALAARHDAVWTLWTIVAFTAIGLWTGATALELKDTLFSHILLVWSMAFALLGGLFVLDRCIRPAGQARWAFRLAALLTLALVTAHGFAALFDSGVQQDILACAFLTLLCAAALFYVIRPMEFGLTVAAALGIDLLLISLLARAILSGRGAGDPSLFLTLGVMAAGVVAGTAALLLRLSRHASSAPSGTGPLEAGKAAPATARTWPVTVLSGIGALLAMIPIVVFFALAFGAALLAWQISLGAGLAIALGGIFMIRTAPPLTFRQQFGFILIVSAYGLIGWGLMSLMRSQNAALVTAILLLITAALTPSGWIRNLFGGALAVALAIWIEMAFLGAREMIHIRGIGVWTILGLAAVAGLLLDEQLKRPNGDREGGLFAELLTGFTAIAILALMLTAGRTFLLGGTTWGDLAGAASRTNTAGWSVWRFASLLAGLVAIGLMAYRGGPAWRTPLAFALGGVGLVLSTLTNQLGPILALLAAAYITGHSVLAGLAAFAALWIGGAFYYWLGWSLTEKAFLLIGLGGALAAVAVASRRTMGTAAHASAESPGLRAAFAIPLIAASGLATAGIVVAGVRGKETIIATGRAVFVELAPVDPRSLMQGDYMALRFVLPALEERISVTFAKPAYGIATVDHRSVATVRRIVYSQPAPASDEIAFKLAYRKKRLMLGTDAWFFREGEAKKFEAARFGAFRVGPDGDMILVGMADKDLAAIR